MVELLVGALLGIGLLSGIAVATQATVHSSRTEVQQGVTTSNVIVAVQAVQQALAGAWTPASANGVTSQCAGGPNGQAWTASGPVATATATDVQFCGFRNNSSTAYTYELHFTGCTSSLCNLQIDQLGAPGCSPHCHSATVFTDGDVSNLGNPFAFYTSSGGSWATTSTLSQIQAVRVTLVVPAISPTGSALNDGTEVQRLIVLPNALGGGS
jgi:hypothetical protein